MAESRAIMSSDGRAAMRADTIEQVDGWLRERISCLRYVGPAGSQTMHLRMDLDALLDRRIELARVARRDGFGIQGRVAT